MRKGFINGLVTGGLLGAIAVMFMSPQLKPLKKEVLHESKMMNKQARKAVKGVRRALEKI